MSVVQRVKCGNVNVYIVSEGGSAILVDTGTKEHLDTVLKACRSYNVRLIVLTHAHYDHAENAAELSERLKAPIAMHKGDVDLIGSNNNQSMSARTIPGKFILAVSLMGFSARKMKMFTPSVFLEDGDDLAGYGVPAKVVGLPGHTKGSIGIDVGGKNLLVGDALMNIFYPTVSMLYNDEKAMLDSAGKITGLGARIIHFGHGRPVKNRVWLK